MKKKSVIRRIVIITGITIITLFTGLTIFTSGLVSASSQETADNDVQIISESYASYVAAWLTENLNLLEFYAKSDVIHNAEDVAVDGAFAGAGPLVGAPG